MTRNDAKMTLCANVMVACERAKFDKATCRIVEDALTTAIEALDQPEIVKCKDCRDYLTIYCACDEHSAPDWFCADGKRR